MIALIAAETLLICILTPFAPDPHYRVMGLIAIATGFVFLIPYVLPYLIPTRPRPHPKGDPHALHGAS